MRSIFSTKKSRSLPDKPLGESRKVEGIGLGKHGCRAARHFVFNVDDLEQAAISRRLEKGCDY